MKRIKLRLGRKSHAVLAVAMISALVMHAIDRDILGIFISAVLAFNYTYYFIRNYEYDLIDVQFGKKAE
ncbi:hypothetical protein [Priestia megaterium]|uniref:hypothetical protein n=1 Tax=Priestia megaterium TaxID=1404 RepID=UPI0039F6583C